MPYFEDLSEYTYSKGNTSGLVNIGWLDSNHTFNTGEVDVELALTIAELCRNPVNRTRGYQHCWACTEFPIQEPIGRGGQILTLGDAEIHIAGSNKVYVCPTLIYHYIARHKYKPPQEFLNSVRFVEQKSRLDREHSNEINLP